MEKTFDDLIADCEMNGLYFILNRNNNLFNISVYEQTSGIFVVSGISSVSYKDGLKKLYENIIFLDKLNHRVITKSENKYNIEKRLSELDKKNKELEQEILNIKKSISHPNPSWPDHSPIYGPSDYPCPPTPWVKPNPYFQAETTSERNKSNE